MAMANTLRPEAESFIPPQSRTPPVEELAIIIPPQRTFHGATVTFSPTGALVFGVVPFTDATTESGSIKSSHAGGAVTQHLITNSVSCRWPKICRRARFEYSSVQALQAGHRVLESYVMPSGRCPTFQIYAQPRRIGLNVNGLDVDLSAGDLYQIFSDDDEPSAIKLMNLSHEATQEEIDQTVEVFIRSIGDVQEFRRCDSQTAAAAKAIAIFSYPQDALKAAQILQKKSIDGIGYLHVERKAYLKFIVPSMLENHVKEPFAQIERDIDRRDIQFVVHPSAPDKPYATYKIGATGDEAIEALGAMRDGIDKLLAGTVALDENGCILWDEFFASLLAVSYLAGLSAAKNIRILRDLPSSRILMYGGSEADKMAVERSLRAKVKPPASEHPILLTSPMLRHALQGSMKRLESKFGNAVRLVIPKAIIFKGSVNEFEEVKDIFFEGFPQTLIPTSTKIHRSEPKDCPVCFCPVVEPVEMTCGHTYCTACFFHQVQAPRMKDVPLKCCGDNNTCTNSFTMNHLRSLIPMRQFDTLLESAFDSYIRTHPNEHRYCPSSDCTAIYTPSTDSLITCPSCLGCICTSCNSMFHRGQSCAEHADERDNTEGLKQYYEENDVRECPACSMRMFRVDGCAHMMCTGCEAHVCWGCMRVFGDEELVYKHIRGCERGQDMS